MIVYVITSFTLLLLIFSIDLSPQISFGWPKARNRKWNHKNYSKSVYVHYHKWSLYRWIRKKSRYIYRRTNEQKEIMQWPNCRPGSDERQFWYHFVWAYHIYIYSTNNIQWNMSHVQRILGGLSDPNEGKGRGSMDL